MMTSRIILKKCEVAISETEKLLIMWMEAQIQKCLPLSLITIQVKATKLFEDLKEEIS